MTFIKNKTIITSLLVSLLLAYIAVSIKSSYANELEIISLNNRPASDLIPIIKPLLDKNGSISGENYTLFIRTSNKNLKQIKNIIDKLDADYRLLTINILQESAETMKRYGYKLTAKQNTTTSKTYTTSHLKHHPNIQTLQVTEGQWATLQTGISIPTINRTTNTDGTVTESLQYQTVFTRLKIQPVLTGEKIRIQLQSITGKEKNLSTRQPINTTIKGRLNKWIALGGIQQSVTPANTSYVFTTQRHTSTTKQLFVKIEISQNQE